MSLAGETQKPDNLKLNYQPAEDRFCYCLFTSGRPDLHRPTGRRVARGRAMALRPEGKFCTHTCITNRH